MKPQPVLAFLAALVASAFSEGEKNYGPFDIEIDKVEECDVKGNGDVVIDNLIVKAISKNTMEVSFVATNKIPFDDDIFVSAEVGVYDEETKSYGSEPLKLPIGSVCSSFQTYFPKTISKFFQALGVEGCPIKPNTWSMKKFPMEMSLPIARLPYEKVRTDVFFRKNEALVLCTRVFFSILPEGTVNYPAAT